MTWIETDRLRLRSLAQKDADIMYDYRNNETCARYQRGQTRDREGIEALVARHQDDVLSAEAPCMHAQQRHPLAGVYFFLQASPERLRLGSADGAACMAPCTLARPGIHLLYRAGKRTQHGAVEKARLPG